MALLRIGPLPDEPLQAAAVFHAEILPRILPDAAPLVLVFPPADHAHRGWRRAAVQSLARRWAPLRINAVAGAQEDAIRAVDTYLSDAPGITGQYLPLAAPGSG